jgi:hypothetical protein
MVALSGWDSVDALANSAAEGATPLIVDVTASPSGPRLIVRPFTVKLLEV